MRVPLWAWVAGGAVVVVGVVALARRAVNIPRFYWQGSEPWGGQHLGFGSLFIADAGCLETCVAMASNALAGTAYDPEDVNDIAKAADAFSGSLLKLEDAAAAVDVRAPESARIHSGRGASVDELRTRIQEALARKGVAAVNVDHTYAGSGAHWVLVHGSSGGAFVAADPALGRDIEIDVGTLRANSAWNNQPVVVGVAPIYRA